ncbi:TPA: hypothetical protein KDZ97_005041 [Vibrio parahaemolyticus]|uniref:hypothetical protein n=1 Tax=Vibrio parahaemolyticus TaxID=670 RepID=UPI001B838159|nr:hypothetical protein [Vibrio parahaemolyticus]MDF5646696.1 hypothetical protein [Vibrio parahaemolyticus]MDF5666045.1 hypothetical protein [Vibrio parahaemolyticus]WKV19628.1 hypothetical protein [Vibrio parahaemolyticus]HBC3404736.1 hypothetical protein [Vibrio parahaemolyticus]HBC3540461.1 hypothetical protein [Vibrio parahaemolyticus]
MTDLNDEEIRNLKIKRDRLATGSVIGLYCLSIFSQSIYGLLFSSLFLFHFAALYMMMDRKKLFGIDIMYLLLPQLASGFVAFFLLNSNVTGNAFELMKDVDLTIWFACGLGPAFIHRGFNHYLGLTKNGH